MDSGGFGWIRVDSGRFGWVRPHGGCPRWRVVRGTVGSRAAGGPAADQQMFTGHRHPGTRHYLSRISNGRRVGETDTDLVELARSGPVHFVGIGGAGMAPLAEMLLLAGGQVTGCQDQVNAAARLLERHGAVITEGHDPAHVADCLAVVMTAAVPDDHPEIAA